MIQAPEVKYARYADGAIAGVAAAVAGAFIATQAIDFVAPLNDSLLSHLKFWSHGALKIMSGFETDSWRDYSHYLDQVAASSTPYIISWRLYSVAAVSLATGLTAGWHAGKPISDVDKISGNDLLRDKEAIKYFNSQSEKDGLKLANGLHLDLNKETEHWLISGGTGAGKSVTATTVLVPALERGDRVILVNYKGLTEKFPVILNTESKDYDAIILCPFDKRSVAWAVWKDVTTKSQAREFSARVIPDSKDPVWSNSARFLMTGILMYLINTYTKNGKNWSWKMFADLCVASREDLVKILEVHYREGLRAIKDEGKTSESVMMNFAAFAAPIIDLSDAWDDREKGFSFESWVNNPESKVRTVILQISSEFKVLSQAFNQSILNQVGTYLTRLPDVKASQAPLWIYADEFPRLGQAIVFEELFSVGRSKSMRIMIAIQSLGQLKKEYGIELSEGWVDSIGTKLMGRQDGVAGRWISEMCGEAVYVQLQNGRLDPNGSGRVRNTYSPPQTYSVFPPQLAQNELGIVKQHWLAKLLKLKPAGVRMLIHGAQGADLIVNFPFIPLPILRKETVLADAFKGGFGYAQTIDIEELITSLEKEVANEPNSTPADFDFMREREAATAQLIDSSINAQIDIQLEENANQTALNSAQIDTELLIKDVAEEVAKSEVSELLSELSGVPEPILEVAEMVLNDENNTDDAQENEEETTDQATEIITQNTQQQRKRKKVISRKNMMEIS